MIHYICIVYDCNGQIPYNHVEKNSKTELDLNLLVQIVEEDSQFINDMPIEEGNSQSSDEDNGGGGGGGGNAARPNMQGNRGPMQGSTI